MTSTWIGIGIEAIVAVLLAITISYCVMLNSRLKRLRADESQLKATILELVRATEIAERAILGLKQAAQDCDQTLAKRVREAEFFSVEIAREIGEGEQVLDRIAQITRTVRGISAPAAAEPEGGGEAGAPAAAPAPAADAKAPRMSELKMKFAQSAERLASLRKDLEGQAA
ncbi:DUF6468 domain-containing protein [Prosthecomicrobium sp. N25]|uniref:DUF6468 domain-containing protein n=1 Tax=Prosthecomicrobium sp. N25 TaxID=3129254 RepID=UPI0030774228